MCVRRVEKRDFNTMKPLQNQMNAVCSYRHWNSNYANSTQILTMMTMMIWSVRLLKIATKKNSQFSSLNRTLSWSSSKASTEKIWWKIVCEHLTFLQGWRLLIPPNCHLLELIYSHMLSKISFHLHFLALCGQEIFISHSPLDTDFIVVAVHC